MQQTYFKTPEPSSYFAPMNKTEVNEDLLSLENGLHHTSDERLSVLHSRLHNEAEKIRKWKLHTEMELKQKEKSLAEANQTNESLRKSTLELQLQIEELSSKLQEDLATRTEITSSIQSTRDMCNILKEYATNLEERFRKCETEKTEIKYLEKEHMTECEDLSKRFNELTIAVNAQKASVKEIVETERREKSLELENYLQQLKQANQNVTLLEEDCREKTTLIKELDEKLSVAEAALKSLKNDYAEIQENMGTVESENKTKDAELSGVKEQLDNLKDSLTKLKKEFQNTSKEHEMLVASKDQLSKDFDETEKLYVDKIKSLKEDLSAALSEKESTRNKSQELQQSLNKAKANIEELKCAKDMLLLERTEAQSKINGLEKQQTTMKEEFSEMQESIKDLNAGILTWEKKHESLQNSAHQLEQDLDAKNAHTATIEANFAKLTIDFQSAEEREQELQSQLHDALSTETEILKKIDALEDELRDERNEHQEVRSDLSNAQECIARLVQEAAMHAKEVKKLSEDFQNAESEKQTVEEQLNSLQDELNRLQQQLEEYEELKEANEQRTNQLHAKESEMAKLSSDVEKANNKVQEHKEKIAGMKAEHTAKNKHVKELEKEIRTLKSNLNSNLKKGSKIEDVTKDLEEKLHAMQAELDKSHQLVETLQNTAEECNNTMEHLKKEADEERAKADKEKQHSDHQYEDRIHILSRGLEQYKNGYEEVIVKKEKEIGELKLSIEELTTEVEKLKESTPMSEIDQNKLSDSTREATKLQKELSQEKKYYENTLKKHENEIQSLKKKLESSTDKEDGQRKQNSECQSEIKKLRDTLQQKDVLLASLKDSVNKSHEKVKPVAAVTSVERTPVMTPRRILTTPQSDRRPIAKTPASARHSILKPFTDVTNTVDSANTKRRKVAFHEVKLSSPDSEESDLMEVEFNESQLSKKGRTPLQLKPSFVSKASPCRSVSLKIAQTPSRRTPQRGGGRGGLRPAETPKKADSAEAENEMFGERFPSLEKRRGKSPLGLTAFEARMKGGTPNTRTAPVKSPGKFFRSMQREKPQTEIRAIKKKQKTDTLFWFDTDSTFGFGLDD